MVVCRVYYNLENLKLVDVIRELAVRRELVSGLVTASQ
jgi:hypothetical protein